MTREELIIEMQPFSDELREWCKNHSNFAKALKVVYPEKFITLGAIVTSYSPYRPEDEIIGFFVYNYRRNNPIFKQDFIVNKGKRNEEFVLYTRFNDVPKDKYIKDIKEFEKIYGRDRYYLLTHHLSLSELPNEIVPRAIQAMNLADRIKKKGLINPTIEDMQKAYDQIKNLSEEEKTIKKKL